ncbi:hypothetical protein QQM79_09985 [Marinobacteraceae bacterium S3BR75-40.1]
MKSHWQSALIAVTLGLLVALPGHADDLGVTMRMVEGDEDLTREIVQQIELPERLEHDGGPGALSGQEPPGQERAREVREVGRDVAEQARERREAVGPPADVPGKGPEAVPERPQLPDDPNVGRPDNPGRSHSQKP